MKISAGTFIRNSVEGAFCLFESLATFMALPHIEDVHIVDLGSTDGTLEILKTIAASNPRVYLHQSQFSKIDAGAFADAANQAVSLWKNDVGIFWQADEILHESLLDRFASELDAGKQSLCFWRYQLRDNFQAMKWFPHPVHRLGMKGQFNFVNDGMNTDNVFGNDVVSDYNMGWFTKWGTMPELEIPVEQMMLDVSLVGGFRDNIIGRRKLHAPMWHESDSIEGKRPDEWYIDAIHNPCWTAQTSPFAIPAIMKWHVGRVRYDVRPELIQALIADRTGEYLWTLR